MLASQVRAGPLRGPSATRIRSSRIEVIGDSDEDVRQHARFDSATRKRQEFRPTFVGLRLPSRRRQSNPSPSPTHKTQPIRQARKTRRLVCGRVIGLAPTPLDSEDQGAISARHSLRDGASSKRKSTASLELKYVTNAALVLSA